MTLSYRNLGGGGRCPSTSVLSASTGCSLRAVRVGTEFRHPGGEPPSESCYGWGGYAQGFQLSRIFHLLTSFLYLLPDPRCIGAGRDLAVCAVQAPKVRFFGRSVLFRPKEPGLDVAAEVQMEEGGSGWMGLCFSFRRIGLRAAVPLLFGAGLPFCINRGTLAAGDYLWDQSAAACRTKRSSAWSG